MRLTLWIRSSVNARLIANAFPRAKDNSIVFSHRCLLHVLIPLRSLVFCFFPNPHIPFEPSCQFRVTKLTSPSRIKNKSSPLFNILQSRSLFFTFFIFFSHVVVHWLIHSILLSIYYVFIKSSFLLSRTRKKRNLSTYSGVFRQRRSVN